MKISESLLRSLLDLPKTLSLDKIAEDLTGLGLETSAMDGYLDVELTPNRGDCASVWGIARECAALYQCSLPTPPEPGLNDVDLDEGWPLINIQFSAASAALCPYYYAIELRYAQPIAQEGLNFLHTLQQEMLTLYGIPILVYDRAQIQGDALFFDKPASAPLSVADAQGSCGLGGVALAARVAPTPQTCALLLESAHCLPTSMVGHRGLTGIPSEAVYRYERGIDPCLIPGVLSAFCWSLSDFLLAQKGQSIRRLKKSILGEPPRAFPFLVPLSLQKLRQYLGNDVDQDSAAARLLRIGCQCDMHPDPAQWLIRVPSYRPDLSSDVALIGEILRGLGSEQIPAEIPAVRLSRDPDHAFQRRARVRRFKDKCVEQGFFELRTYSFVDPLWEEALSLHPALTLNNPMSREKSVMRTTLWGGLLDRAAFLQARQQERLRLFEVGSCFIGEKEPQHWACLLEGAQHPLAWHADMKAMIGGVDIQILLEILFPRDVFSWTISMHPMSHPALAYRFDVHNAQGECLCYGGPLSTTARSLFGLKGPVWLLEGDLCFLENTQKKLNSSLFFPSKFPSSSRDLSIVIPRADLFPICLSILKAPEQKECGGEVDCVETVIFDRYSSADGTEYLGIRFFFEPRGRTLEEKAIEAYMNRVLKCFEDAGFSLRTA